MPHQNPGAPIFNGIAMKYPKGNATHQKLIIEISIVNFVSLIARSEPNNAIRADSTIWKTAEMTNNFFIIATISKLAGSCILKIIEINCFLQYVHAFPANRKETAGRR